MAMMVSSSAIISKILHESGANHERSGQLAMGVSVLEDGVAVVMLTLLGSMAGAEAAPASGGPAEEELADAIGPAPLQLVEQLELIDEHTLDLFL